MFSSRSIGRSGRQMAQSAFRAARPSQVTRGYASAASGSSTGSLRKGVTLALVGLGSASLGAGATWKAFTRNGLGFYSDEDSLQRFVALDEEAKQVEDTINNHPLVAELRSRPELVESRPHMKMPQQYRARSMTAGVLLGPRKMVVPPYVWIEGNGKSLVSVSYIGDDLCGHPGIVHGGLLATMLDEGLARCSFGALPHNISVTANLNIDYRKPAPAGSFVVLRAETVKVEGRKCWVKGHVELLAKPGEKATVLAEATALYISPKYAAMMPKIQ